MRARLPDEMGLLLSKEVIKAEKLTDEQLLEVAKEFREGILDGNPSQGYCAMVSWALQGFLSAMYGINSRCASGYVTMRNGDEWGHLWLVLEDGRVLDATFDQFGTSDDPWVPVYLGPPHEIHKESAR